MTTTLLSQEQLSSILDRVQRTTVKLNDLQLFLICEERDWYVVMQVLIDKGILRPAPTRPPYARFINLLQSLNLKLYLTRIPTSRILGWQHGRPLNARQIALQRYLAYLIDMSRNDNSQQN